MKTLYVLAATACMAGVGGSTSIGAVHRSASCATKAGQILSYLPSAGRKCVAKPFEDDPLYATETIKTGSPVGGFTFKVTGLYQCHESPGARDTIRPSPSVALKHLQGTTWCKRKPHSPKQFLTLKGAKIETTGTIFGIQSGKRSVIKVSEGRLQVIPRATGRPIKLPAGRQLSISAKGVPGVPRKFSPTPQDRFVVFLLRTGDLESGAKAGCRVPPRARSEPRRRGLPERVGSEPGDDRAQREDRDDRRRAGKEGPRRREAAGREPRRDDGCRGRVLQRDAAGLEGRTSHRSLVCRAALRAVAMSPTVHNPEKSLLP